MRGHSTPHHSSSSSGSRTTTAFAPLSIATMADDDDDDDGHHHHNSMLQQRQQLQQQQAQAYPVTTAPAAAIGNIVQLPPQSRNTASSSLPGDYTTTTNNTSATNNDDTTQQPHHHETVYRGGFSTSICDLFQDPRDRTSCCAVTCCGTFLQDRNRYLLTGELPPPWWMRIIGYLGGTLVVILVGVVMDALAQQGFLYTWVLPVIFVTGMMIRATNLRQQVRLLLLQRMAEHRPELQAGQPQNQPYYSVRNEHWCCALVSNDKRQVLVPTLYDNGQRERRLLERQQRQQADFCFRLWQLLSCLCCDSCCMSWCHWCGMCATGQEDRELRRLLPPQVFWRDYITFQPYGDYYPKIQWLRHEQVQSMSFWNHLGALSELSTKLGNMLLGSLLFLLLAATFHIWRSFSLIKVIIIVGTLFQAFLILYLVYWRKHRLDVSLDAMIKFFASGFLLAPTVAVVVELILDFLGEIIFSFVMTNEYIVDHPEMTFDDDVTINNGGPFADVNTFKTAAKQHYLTLLVYLFFKAVIVAALVEELTKYFCFWMVEHPDYIYGAARHVNEEMGEEGAFCNDNNLTSSSSPTTEGVAVPPPTAVPDASGNQGSLVPPTSPSQSATNNLPPFVPRETPNHTTAGAAITVGMIATAAGFSCSENLMYIFSENSVAGEISVLLARSALPVHSICAAIQSIGVVRRDVEQDTNYKIGWAILPAVLLHGFFDFALLALAFFEYIFSDTPTTGPPTDTTTDDWFELTDDQTAAQQQQQQQQQYVEQTYGQQMLSFGIGAAITMVGVLYYVNEAGKQRGRLQALEMTAAQVPSTAGLVFA